MLDFNRGSYIIRVTEGEASDANKNIRVSNRGDIVLEGEKILVRSQDILALSLIEEYDTLLETKGMENQWLPGLLAILVSFLATGFFINIMGEAANHLILWFFVLVLVAPSLGLLSYYITRNLFNSKRSKLRYEAKLEWLDHEYFVLLDETEVRTIQKR